MIRPLVLVLSFAITATNLSAQKVDNPAVPAADVPAPTASVPDQGIDPGIIVDKTYSNAEFKFSITLPDTWLIPDADYEAAMREKGLDLSLKTPTGVSPLVKAKIKRSLERVTVLLTAYKATPGTLNNAVLRIAVEDLTLSPQVRDAVDYFDLMRSGFNQLKVPPGFKYSETQAEKLGKKQFAFLDIQSSDGKKRMYATVRNRSALLFTISYTNPADLETLRKVLAAGKF